MREIPTGESSSVASILKADREESRRILSASRLSALQVPKPRSDLRIGYQAFRTSLQL